MKSVIFYTLTTILVVVLGLFTLWGAGIVLNALGIADPALYTQTDSSDSSSSEDNNFDEYYFLFLK